jgi:hypothetical protein
MGMSELHFEHEGVERVTIMRDSFNKGHGGDKVHEDRLPSDKADGPK